MASFIKACEVSEISPGQCKGVKIEGKPVALFNVNGSIFACEDVCPHQFANLSMGELNGEVITCTMHSEKYNVRTGEGVRASGGTLKIFQTEIQGSDIMVSVG